MSPTTGSVRSPALAFSPVHLATSETRVTPCLGEISLNSASWAGTAPSRSGIEFADNFDSVGRDGDGLLHSSGGTPRGLAVNKWT